MRYLKFLFIPLLMGVIFFGFVFIQSHWEWYKVNLHLYFLFAFIAGVADAGKDTLAHHFHLSVFKKFKQGFWNPEVSWQGGKILGIMKLDAWHLFKMAHTLFICLTAAYFIPHENKIMGFALVYSSYKAGFNLFYSIVFK